MSKITIPKEAMKYATRLSPNDREFYKNSDKFAEVMHQHYPHLSRHEIDEINLNITYRGIRASTLFEIQASSKKEMLEIHKRYLSYEKRGDFKNLAVLENSYKNITKSCYDDIVDKLKEMGYNTQYAPTDVADLKQFCMYSVNKHEIQTFLISLTIVGLIGLLYLI